MKNTCWGTHPAILILLQRPLWSNACGFYTLEEPTPSIYWGNHQMHLYNGSWLACWTPMQLQSAFGRQISADHENCGSWGKKDEKHKYSFQNSLLIRKYYHYLQIIRFLTLMGLEPKHPDKITISKINSKSALIMCNMIFDQNKLRMS